MIYRANFSREYWVEIEADTLEDAEAIACNMSDDAITQADTLGDGITFWSAEEA